MSHKKILLSLLAALILCLTACGETTDSAAPAAQTPETFGASNLENAREMADTIEMGQKPAPDNQAGSVSESQSSQTADLMAQAVECALAAKFLDGFVYDPGDPVYFWRALGYLVGLGGNPAYPVRDSRVQIPTNEIRPYVTALFGEYTAQYPSLGEENPLVSEEGGMYTVTASGPFGHSFTMTDPEPQGDGTYRCRAEISEGGRTGKYTVTLQDYPAKAGEEPLFPYCITDISEG